MNKKIDLELSIAETNDLFEVKMTNSKKQIVDFRDNNPPRVRAPYFKQSKISKQRLIERSKEDAFDYTEGQNGALKHYIYCREREMHQYTLELRKIMRKFVIAAESADVAKSVLREIAEQYSVNK